MSSFGMREEVEKASGYRFIGVIVAIFLKLNGELRYVVESTAAEAEGLLFIFAEKQLVRRGERAS